LTKCWRKWQPMIVCSCSIDVALLDLYLWKTWTTHNHSGEFEGLCNQCIDPCTHLFVIEAYKTHVGLTVDNLYINGHDKLHAKKTPHPCTDCEACKWVWCYC
jgi:hypothetical protein